MILEEQKLEHFLDETGQRIWHSLQVVVRWMVCRKAGKGRARDFANNEGCCLSASILASSALTT